MGHVHWARELARDLLEEPLPRRWAHSQGVARQARTLAGVLGGEADLVESAAWLHDVGYSPEIATTGFHPLDGARHLRDAHQADGLLCRLVAHHSGAQIEAEERGLRDVLDSEFALPPRHLLDALTYSDMTTGPDGSLVSVDRRLSEILKRYGPEDLVHSAITRSSPQIRQSVRHAERALKTGNKLY